jgi:spore coat protein CotH
MFALLACQSTLTFGDTASTEADTDTDADTDADTDVEVIDDTAIHDSGEDTATEIDIRGDKLFSLDVIHTVDITLSPGGRASLDGDPYTYVVADLTWDGDPYPGVGVRIKGRLGSLRTLDAKAALKVDMLEFDATDELDGIEKFNLNNMVQDCAKVHEIAAYGIHRMFGIPAPRVGYAWVTVDGVDHGLYSVVEDYDDEFLQDNFVDPTGNLYDGDYWLLPDGNLQLVDFDYATQEHFNLDEGVDVGLTDIYAVTNAVVAGAGIWDLIDKEQHARFLAINAWTGHYDSYSYYSNNYRVYFNPANGYKGEFLPWDPDWAFYDYTDVNGYYGDISQYCRYDEECWAIVQETVEALNDTVPGSPVEVEVQAAVDLIEPTLRDDPMSETRAGEVRQCQSALFDWFDNRGGQLDRVGW